MKVKCAKCGKVFDVDYRLFKFGMICDECKYGSTTNISDWFGGAFGEMFGGGK
jgi:hypothetical protein